MSIVLLYPTLHSLVVVTVMNPNRYPNTKVSGLVLMDFTNTLTGKVLSVETFVFKFLVNYIFATRVHK